MLAVLSVLAMLPMLVPDIRMVTSVRGCGILKQPVLGWPQKQNGGVMANAQPISKLIVGAINSAAIHVDALAEKALRKAWLSYALILLIQSKVIWRIWDIKDITSGDTSSYFGTAKKWADGFLVDIVWSPLYTAFYGSLLFVTADTYNATIMHRVVIVLAAAVGVLFVMRQLLPPNLALLGAAWWAILPINYNTLYEVHLFALLPILLVWALVLGKDAAWARGAGL